ncbi:MAG: hypothetical protein ACPG6P_13650 [Akkermansiaceae bacterium]
MAKHPDDFQHLVKRGDRVYTVMCPLNLLGASFGRRMVVLQSSRGNVMLHSPFVLEGEILETVNQLGPVTEVVVPTVFHDTFLNEVQQKYSSANYLVADGAERLIKAKQGSENIGKLALSEWAGDLTVIPIEGMPKVNEYAFIHHPSRSLLVSDLIFNIEGLHGAWRKTMASLLGFSSAPGPSRLFRAMIKDKDAFRGSLEEILTHDFDQIITSHFNVISADGPRVIEQVLNRMLN